MLLETRFTYRFHTKGLLRYDQLAPVRLNQTENIFIVFLSKLVSKVSMTHTYFHPFMLSTNLGEECFQNSLESSGGSYIKKL